MSNCGVVDLALSNEACTPVLITDKRGQGILQIQWADEQVTEVSHLDLRMSCKCAECVAEKRKLAIEVSSINEPKFDHTNQLRIETIEAVGNHALNFKFSDGHYRGIYPWSYLRSLSSAVN